jgi:uncharacterized protein HemX
LAGSRGPSSGFIENYQTVSEGEFSEVRFLSLPVAMRVEVSAVHTSAGVFRASHSGKSSEGRSHPKRSRSMKRRFAILLAAALVSVSGAAACGGVQEELQKRAQEEVEKGRQQVEQKAQEERRKVEKKVQEKVQEGRQRVEEEVKKGQKQLEKRQ